MCKNRQTLLLSLLTAGISLAGTRSVRAQSWDRAAWSYGNVVINSDADNSSSGEESIYFKIGDYNSGGTNWWQSNPDMCIRGNGRVGILTNSPMARIDILGGAGLDGTPIAENNNSLYRSTGGSMLAFQYSGGGFRHFIRSRHNTAANNSGNGIDFFLNNSTTAGESWGPTFGNVLGMSITAAGVGIGTATPAFKLDVVGRSRFRSGNNETAGFWLNNNGTTDRVFMGMWNNDYAGWWGSGCGWNIVMNADNGNVGIGTTAPGAKLEVSGGNLKVKPKGANNVECLIASSDDGDGWIGTTTNHGLTLSANNGNGADLYLSKSNMFIGVGNSTPKAYLDIRAGADNNGGNDRKAMAFQYRSGGYRHWISTRHNSVANNNQNAIDFYLNNSTTSEASSAPGTGSVLGMSVSATGVGIGTKDPSSKLQIVTTASRTAAGEVITRDGAQPFIKTSLRVSNTGNSTSTEYGGYFGINTWGPTEAQQKYPFLNFETTRDDMHMNFEINGKSTMQIFNGQVLIGSGLPFPASDAVVPWSGMNAALKVRGRIAASGITCKDLSQWADYVFDEDYTLKPLEEVEAYVAENKHLPDVPSEKEVIEKGIDVSDMLRIQMQKIEELTLYNIEQQKQLKEQQLQIRELQQKLLQK